MIHTYHFPTTRSARYATLGQLNSNTTEIWLVVHGYAQLASNFLKNFEGLENENRFFIAPEGLSRFYAKGFGGNPVASWMTSEDRENEIKDYIQYIDSLMNHMIPMDYQGKIMVLGFSQGVATLTRWMHASHRKVDSLFIYAGQIAAELTHPISDKLKSVPITYITGSKDPLLKPEQKIAVDALMQKLQAKVVTFEGGHEVKREVLRLILS